MNTKTTKMLAVLAVLAMAFAAAAIIAPSQEYDAEGEVVPTAIITGDTSLADVTKDQNYVVTADAIVTVASINSQSGIAIFYALPGVSLTLSSGTLTNASGLDISIFTLKSMTDDNKIPGTAVENSNVVLDNFTKLGITYVASTYTGTVCNKDATISGEVTVGNGGVTSANNGETAVKGTFKANKILNATNFVPGTAYIYSVKTVEPGTGAAVTDTFTDVTYYGADSAKTVTIAKDKTMLVEAFKGDITVVVNYCNNDQSGTYIADWNGDKTTTFTMTGLTGTTGIAVRSYGYNSAIAGQNIPSVFGTNTAATVTLSGAAAVPASTAFNVSGINAFSSVTRANITGSTYNDWAFLGSTPNWLMQHGVDADGYLNNSIYALGEVTGDAKVNTADNIIYVETTAKYTGTVTSYDANDNIVSQIELTAAVVSNQVQIDMGATNKEIVVYFATNDLKLTAGEIDVVKGQMTLDTGADRGFTIGENATLSVKAGTKLFLADNYTTTINPAAAIVFIVKGTMKVAGTIEGTLDNGDPSYISVLKGDDYTGKFTAKSGAVFSKFIVKGSGDATTTGTINLTDAMSVESVSGDTIYAREYSQLQTVKVTGPYTVKNGVTLTIRGTFEVPAGVTVGIENDAKIVVTGDTSKVDIAGTLSVAEGTHFIADSSVAVNVSGSIYSEGAVYINSVAAKIADGGKFVSEGQLYIAGNGMAVATGGTLDIRSNFNIAKLQNSGTVILNDAVLTRYAYDAGNFTLSAATDAAAAASSEILMYEKGAEVKIISLGWNNNVLAGTTTFMKIKDAGLKTSSGYDQVKDNYVTIQCVDKTYGISGLTITEKVSSVANTNGVGGKTSGQMILSGSVDYINSTEPDDDKVKVILGATNASTASDKKSDIVIEDSLRIGEFVGVETINADITVKGTFTLVKNSTITPTSGKITVTGKLLVLGSNALPANLGNILNGAVYKVVGDEYTYMVVTNFTDAVKDNADNTELTNVTVYGSVSTTDDLSIPELVKIKAGTNTPTLTVGSGTVNTNTVLLKNGSEIASGIAIIVKATLTAENYKNLKATEITADVKIVNGDSVTYTNILTAIGSASYGDVITASGDVVISSDTTIPEGVTDIIGDDASLKINKNVTVTVAGTLKSEKDIAAGTGAVFGDNTKIVVPGVMQVAKPKTLDAYKISGAYYSDDDYNYVAPLATAIENAKSITVKGKVTVDDLAIAGTSSSQKTVTIDENSELVADSLDLSYAKVVMNGAFTGTILDDYATVYFENVKGLTVTSKTEYDLKGTAVVTDDKGKVSVISGVVTVTAPLALTDSKLTFTVASVADLFVTKSTSTVGQLTVADGVVIGGDVTTINGGSIVDEGKIYILGNLVVAAADSAAGTTAGSASLKKVFVGIDPESLQESTSAGAAISGASIGSPDYVAVAAGSAVDEQIVADKKFTVFNVDGAAYMTVYAIENAPAIKSFALPIIENAVATEWGNPLTEKAVTTEKVGSLAVVYAMIDYNIYKIEVYTDAGIKAVSIDGIEMFNELNNKFTTLSNIKAGTHTVSYTLKNGYEGTAQLYTADGTILKDLKFVTSGTDDIKDGKVTVVLQLNGTEQIIAPEPTPVEQNEWTITTILLVILVILIAVMAVIVALRLNRS